MVTRLCWERAPPGHLEVVRVLCEAVADKDKATVGGATALMRASFNGHLEVVQLLCETGADKDKANRNGNTALMEASWMEYLEVARLLREAGADNDTEGEFDCATALMRASTN